MKISEAPLSGLIIIEPKIFNDHRGYFFESFQQERYAELGIPEFVQDNQSHSKKDILRGLHYQLPHAQGKLVSVLRGSVWDVVVDLRRSSPTFGQWFGITLDDKTHTQMYVPAGFAHGFCVLSEEADFLYKCTDYYAPNCEAGIVWNDPDLNITWPCMSPILAEKDQQLPRFSEIKDDKFFA